MELKCDKNGQPEC